MSAATTTPSHPSSHTSLRRHVRRATGRDLSPLCRPLDQAYSRLVAGLAVAMLATLVVAAVAALLVYRAETHTAQQTARHQHVVTAVTTGAALSGGSRTGGLREYAPARWTYPVGPGAGRVPVPDGTPAGTTVPVGLNDAGNPVAGPKPADLIAMDAVLVGCGTVTVLGFGAQGAFALRRRALDRRAEKGWEAAWELVEPRWSGRR
ncbi:hypothetical protein ABTY61_36780 [Kitasatospora sp. NPDC096128]|uniref:Rv1733c family protein n=1 Tax=Kitasatospora sp. NPDC096128 TaxID=3155547 RepID=UPI00332FF7A7